MTPTSKVKYEQKAVNIKPVSNAMVETKQSAVDRVDQKHAQSLGIFQAREGVPLCKFLDVYQCVQHTCLYAGLPA